MNNDLRTYLNEKISVLPKWLSAHLHRTAELAVKFADYYEEDNNINENFFVKSNCS